MYPVRKLKPDRSIGGLIPVLGMLAIFGLSTLIFGITVGLFTGAVMIWIYGLYCLFIFLRMGNFGHLFLWVYMLFLGVMAVLASQYVESGWDPDINFMVAWISGVVFFGTLLIYLAATKKIKWRGREVFELAAEPVEAVGDGYTPRPRPIGRVEFTKEEILAFARFAARNLISIVYYGPRQVTFVPVKMGDEYTYPFRLHGSYHEATWINFDFEGEVSVHIARKDYLDYKEPLDFDRLCESLGQLFVEFVELHKKGEDVRIIDRMDALRLVYFS
jgi:hypothetical protein